MNEAELATIGASRLVSLIRRRELSVREVISVSLSRADDRTDLNAVVGRCDERALEEADRADDQLARGETDEAPLLGLPFTVKDVIDTAGVRTTAGSPAWRDRVPDDDATVVARLRAAGAILIGKTNTSELMLEYETDNDVFGQTHNPYDPSLSPGGSTGGGAAAVASGISALEVGTDTGGSIRLPAHFCGVAGIKPTAGLLPRTGIAAVFGTPVEPLAHVGPIARRVEDLGLVLEVLAGPDGRDPMAVPLAWRDGQPGSGGSLRVGYFTEDGVTPVTDDVSAAVGAAVEVLRERGTETSPVRLPGVEETEDLFRSLFLVDGYAWVGRLLAEMGAERSRLLPRGVKEDVGQASEWSTLFRRLDRYRRRMLAFLDSYDVIIAPVHPEPARPPHVLSGRDRRTGYAYAQIFNLTGWPAVAVPAGSTSDGLPVGVQVVSHPGRDLLTLETARIIEHELGGFRPPPDTRTTPA